MDKINNLLMFMNIEFEAENYKEAENIAGQILLLDINNLQAWLVKAKTSYHLDRGLKSSYQYLTNAIMVKKDKQAINDILDTFYYVSYKELKYGLSRSLDRIDDSQYVDEYISLVELFNKESGKVLEKLNEKKLTDTMLYKVKNDFMKHAFSEIKRTWNEVAKEYYQDALSDYGKRWEQCDDYVNDYRPSEYVFTTFNNSAIGLMRALRSTITLNNLTSDLSPIVDALNLCITMMNCTLKGKGYKEVYESGHYDEKSRTLYEDDHYWVVALKNGPQNERYMNDVIHKCVQEISQIKQFQKERIKR